MGKSIKLKITEAMLKAVGDAFSMVWNEHFETVNKASGCGLPYYRTALYRLKRRGLVKVVSRQGRKFIELTAAGQLKNLLLQAAVVKTDPWDRKWRLIIFDIPEDAKHKRDELRKLLKQYNFKKLQASVFISPYALNRQAIDFLKQTGLIEFIRILRVDEMDYDQDLRSKFKI